jgi:hypothetical protein
MSVQTVEFVEYKERTVKFRRDDVFAVNPKKKMLWLQRLCIWLLTKLECQWWDDKTEFTRHTIDSSSFAHNLYKQKSALFGYFREEGQTLLIGSEDYAKLMSTPEFHSAISFQTEFKRGIRDSNNEPVIQVYGLTVKVIPWMRGMVVMP